MKRKGVKGKKKMKDVPKAQQKHVKEMLLNYVSDLEDVNPTEYLGWLLLNLASSLSIL